MRHVAAHRTGEMGDPETTLHPLAHAACEIMFALTFEHRGMSEQVDDRPPEPASEGVAAAASPFVPDDYLVPWWDRRTDSDVRELSWALWVCLQELEADLKSDRLKASVVHDMCERMIAQAADAGAFVQHGRPLGRPE